MKKWIAVLFLVAMMCTLVACSSTQQQSDNSTVIRVGSKDFTENLVVAEIYALALEDAGFTVERKLNLAGSIVHTAIVNDEIDLYPEYTGTGLLSILKMKMMTDPVAVYDTVKAAYDQQFALTWLDQSQANDSQGLVIRTQLANDLGIYTISDLQANAQALRFCSQGDFEQREDGIPGLEKMYGEFNFASIRLYDGGLKYQILKNDEADVAPAYTTEGQLVNTDLFTLLEDDKQMWPPYFLAPVVRNDVLEENPEIAEVLNKISATLDTETVTALNAQVDVDQIEYEEVALTYYNSIQ